MVKLENIIAVPLGERLEVSSHPFLTPKLGSSYRPAVFSTLSNLLFVALTFWAWFRGMKLLVSPAIEDLFLYAMTHLIRWSMFRPAQGDGKRLNVF